MVGGRHSAQVGSFSRRCFLCSNSGRNTVHDYPPGRLRKVGNRTSETLRIFVIAGSAWSRPLEFHIPRRQGLAQAWFRAQLSLICSEQPAREATKRATRPSSVRALGVKARSVRTAQPQFEFRRGKPSRDI